VIGGILASTFVAVFFVPLFFWILESFSERFGARKAPEGAGMPAAHGGAASDAPQAPREGD